MAKHVNVPLYEFFLKDSMDVTYNVSALSTKEAVAKFSKAKGNTYKEYDSYEVWYGSYFMGICTIFEGKPKLSLPSKKAEKYLD